jgi:cytochrome c-type protein NapC
MKSLWQQFRTQRLWAKFLEVQTLMLLMVGAAMAVGGKVAVDHTNTLEFCISCHEMKENNFAEYSHTIHARNRTGVKAICSDCHVPHEFFATVVRKVGAANDVVHHLLGTIDTPEKFEARRLEMAKAVWRTMKATDSRECRSCHDVKAMDPQMQGKTAQKQHQKLTDSGRTCIDCHYGIAHKEPAGGMEPQDAVMSALKE